MLQLLLSLALAIAAVAISSRCYCSATEYYVSAADGLPCPAGRVCHPLSYYADEQNHYKYFTNNAVFYFMEGTHILVEQIIIASVSEISFKGLGSIVQGFDETVMQSTAVIKCLNSNTLAGLNFIGGNKLLLSHITITGCQSRVAYNGVVSVDAYSRVTLEYVAIINNTGFGLTISDTFAINISSCSFAANQMRAGIPANSVSLYVVYGLILQDTNITYHDASVPGLAIIAMKNTDGFTAMTMIINNVLFYKNEKLACSVLTDEDLTLNKYNEYVIHLRYIYIKNSIFKSNGDGINLHLSSISNVYFENTSLSHNDRTTLTMISHEGKFHALVNYYFQNVTLAHNSKSETRNPVIILEAMAERDKVILNFNNTLFAHNHGTPLFVDDFAQIVFETAVVFKGNTGYNGGAIVMDSYTQMVVSSTTKVMFIDNHAINHGGAIYVLPNTTEVGRHFAAGKCFYRNSTQIDNKNTIFYFKNNTARVAGSVIYGSNVTKCEEKQSFSAISSFINQPGYSVISSDVSKVCFCDSTGKPACSNRNKAIAAAPGQVIKFSATAVGNMDGLTQSVIQISDNFSLYNQNVSTKCAALKHTILSLDNSNISVITISVVDSPYGISPSPIHIVVTIAPCPDGFSLSNDTHMCQCYSAVSSVATCNSSSGTVTRKGNTWLAYDEQHNCTIAHRDCPFDYCITDSVTLSLTDPDVQCSLNRAGRLCGGCPHNYSLLLGSNKCQKCEITDPRFLLVIPLGIAGIALVALLIFLNLTVSVGTINGLMFYANIVKLYEPIFFPNGPITFLSPFISWLNLDLGIETCFYPGMTACHKMWLQFVFPFYLWMLIVIVIIACRYSVRVTRIVGNNAVPVLATLILLSYTKLLRTIILILSLTRVSCDNVSTLYWLVDPNIPYLSSCHLPLFIAAVSVLFILVVPYTVLLLVFPLLETGLRNRWQILQKCYNKLKPFIDAYGGPYRDKFHYWIGVMVLLRVVLALVIALTDDPTIASNTLFAVLAILVMLQCNVMIYKTKFNHALGIWFLQSLSVITYVAYLEQTTTYTDEQGSTNLENSQDNTGIRMTIVLGSSVAVSLGILLYHFFKYVALKQYRRLISYRGNRYNHLLATDELDDELREPLLGLQDDDKEYEY